MIKRKGQYTLIILLFLATNTLYFFAQRDTQKLSGKSRPDMNVQLILKKTTTTNHPGL